MIARMHLSRLRAEIRTLRDWLDSETRSANHYHNLWMRAVECNDAALTLLDLYKRRNIELKARVMDLEEQARRWHEVEV